MDAQVNNERQAKVHKWTVAFNIIIIVLSIIALAVAGVLFYQKRYLSPFWVNGQSMYPTLNSDALNKDGVPYGENGSSTSDGSTMVDYGVMDKHLNAIKKAQRFSVIVCKYGPEDTTEKIKRIVGMPGETIKFGQGDDNGSLYVKKDDEFKLVEQPIDQKYVVVGNYPIEEIKLSSDEYYVLGDNRAHSSDSRGNGPINLNWIIGKVVAICAHCKIRVVDGRNEPYDVKHFPPRFL